MRPQKNLRSLLFWNLLLVFVSLGVATGYYLLLFKFAPVTNPALARPSLPLRPWPKDTSLQRHFSELFSLNTPGVCVLIVGLDEKPRSQGLAALLELSRAGPGSLQRAQALRPTQLREFIKAAASRSDGTASVPGTVSKIHVSSSALADRLTPSLMVSLSHLFALQTAQSTNCSIALVLEDDTSLDLLPYWEDSILGMAAQYLHGSTDSIMLELKVAAYNDFGSSGELALEQLYPECNRRSVIPYKPLVAWGTGAYLVNADGIRRVTRSFEYKSNPSCLDLDRFVEQGPLADLGLIYTVRNTVILWPPYFLEDMNARSATREDDDALGLFKKVHISSGYAAIWANIMRASLCHRVI
jgi:hypothetical protein